MKKITTAIAISLSLISASAFAASNANTEPDNTAFQGVYGQSTSGLTRAQVVEQLQQASAAGRISNGEPDNIAFNHVANPSAQQDSSYAINGQIGSPSAGINSNSEPDNQAAFRS